MKDGADRSGETDFFAEHSSLMRLYNEKCVKTPSDVLDLIYLNFSTLLTISVYLDNIK
jgi:hypothetical protein